MMKYLGLVYYNEWLVGPVRGGKSAELKASGDILAVYTLFCGSCADE